MKCFTFLSLLFALTYSGVQTFAQESDPVLKNSTVKIVEQLRVIETRNVYEAPSTPARKTAIFVDNRSAPKLNDKILFLEDQVASRASGQNFSIISREDVLKAVKTYRGIGAANANTAITDAERNSLGTALDQTLSDNSSALRLAQNMGADFILFVSIGSFAREVKSYEDASIGVKTKNIVYNLRGTYKIVEGVTGGSLGGDAFRTSKTIRQTANLQTDDQDLLNQLLEEAAEKIADGLASKAGQFAPAATPGKVEIAIACGVKDLAGNEISLPDIRLSEDNKVIKGDQDIPVQASATIEIDGFAIGTTPARIKVAPGAHKLRLTRPGFDDVVLTINAADGLTLTPTMQMSKAGFERWQQVREFLTSLDITRQLSDARAEEIRGHAQTLRQSGFIIDYRVNTTQGTPLVSKKSIYSLD